LTVFSAMLSERAMSLLPSPLGDEPQHFDDELASKARDAGLLNAEGKERAFRDALKRDASRKLEVIETALAQASR